MAGPSVEEGWTAEEPDVADAAGGVRSRLPVSQGPIGEASALLPGYLVLSCATSPTVPPLMFHTL
jgi:hypothetical protein